MNEKNKYIYDKTSIVIHEIYYQQVSQK